MIDTAAVIVTVAAAWGLAGRQRRNATAAAAASLAAGATVCLFLPGADMAADIARAMLAAPAAALAGFVAAWATPRRA